MKVTDEISRLSRVLLKRDEPGYLRRFDRKTYCNGKLKVGAPFVPLAKIRLFPNEYTFPPPAVLIPWALLATVELVMITAAAAPLVATPDPPLLTAVLLSKFI